MDQHQEDRSHVTSAADQEVGPEAIEELVFVLNYDQEVSCLRLQGCSHRRRTGVSPGQRDDPLRRL
jgi:hypothetical protein